MRARRIAAAAATVVAATVTLTGCSLFGPSAPERDAETGEIVEGSDSDIFQIRVGDCLAPTDLETDLSSVPTVPCSEPHESEIYDSTQLTGDEFPGVAEVSAQAEEYCLGAFEAFVGVPYDDSELYASTITPSEQSWNEMDDREVLCVIIDTEGEVTGSMRDAGR